MPYPDPHPEFLSGWVCYRSVPAVANDLILVELDGGPCSSFYRPSLSVLISTRVWDAFHHQCVP